MEDDKTLLTMQIARSFRNEVRSALKIAKNAAMEFGAEHESIIRPLYLKLFNEHFCGPGQVAKGAQHQAFDPLAKYLSIHVPGKNSAYSAEDLTALVAFAEDPGDEDESSEEVAAVPGPTPPDAPTLPTDLIALLASALKQTAPSPAPSVAAPKPKARPVATKPLAPADADPFPASLLAPKEPEEPKDPSPTPNLWAGESSGGVSQARGLLRTTGVRSVVDVVGEKGYKAGLERGQREVTDMQTLYFLNWVGTTYPSVLAWVSNRHWKHPRNRQEAEVCAYLIDVMGREAGGHEYTVGRVSMEVLCRRLQALTIMERGGKHGVSTASQWLGVFFQTENSDPVCAVPLQKLEKTMSQLHTQGSGGGGGGKQGKQQE